MAYTSAVAPTSFQCAASTCSGAVEGDFEQAVGAPETLYFSDPVSDE